MAITAYSLKIYFRNHWKEICLLLVSFIISFMVAEIYFRLTSPYIIRKTTFGIKGKEIVKGDYTYFLDTLSGRRLIPNTHVTLVKPEGKIPIDINSNGFRGHEISIKKKDNETRILVLGDSITFAATIYQEKTYVQIAEDCLNDEYKNKREIRLINGGVDGIGLKDEIDILVTQGVDIMPDVVVVGFYLNDGNLPDRLAAGLANPNFIRRHSVLIQTIYRKYKVWQYHRGEMEGTDMFRWITVPPPADLRINRNSFLQFAATAEKDWGAAWNPGPWSGIDNELRRLSLFAKEHRIKVVFLMFPVAFQVYTEYIEDAPQQTLKYLCNKYGFGYYDLLPALRANRKKHKTIFTDWCHLTEEGHYFVGILLARYLMTNTL